MLFFSDPKEARRSSRPGGVPRALLAGLLAAGCGTSSPGRDAPQPPSPITAATPPPPADTAPSIAEPAPPPAPAPPPEPLRARFLSVGDVLFGRRVQEIIDRKGDREHPFRPLAQLYASVDFTFANLENPFYSGKKIRLTPPGKHYAMLWARPEHAATLVKHRFIAVNLANNHTMDQEIAGLDETLRTLDAAGIRHTGAGPDVDAAWTPMFVEAGGLRIGFVGASLTARPDLGLSWSRHVARIEDEERLAAACEAARKGAHFVVATMHAGDEHSFTPNPSQRAFARAAAKAGADVVIGAHPHVVQPAEKIGGTWVFYSLGNFIFDQPLRDNREAVAVELRLLLPPGAARAEIEAIVLHPVTLEESAPTPADEASSARILKRMGATGPQPAP